MKTSALFLSIALASTVLAAAHPRLSPAERLERRRAAHGRGSTAAQHRIEGVDNVAAAEIKNASHVEYNAAWSGAVLTSPPSGEYFAEAVGTFNVPEISKGSGSSDWAASAWVGIDGYSYQNSILQAGIDFGISTSGDVYYYAWYEWYPDQTYVFENLDVAEGDSLKVTIEMTSETSGNIVIDNETSGGSGSISLTSPQSDATLVGETAEWIMEAFFDGDSQVPVPDFHTITFTDSYATGSGGTEVGLSDATIIDLTDASGSDVMAECDIISDSSAECTYTG